MERKLLFVILVSSIVFFGPAGAATNLVCNPSFEIDVDPADGVPDG